MTEMRGMAKSTNTYSMTRLETTKIESTKDVEKLFIKRIVERRAEVEKRRGEIHLTDLTSECLRRVWYDKHDPLPDDPPDLIRMWQGAMPSSLMNSLKLSHVRS